jgi:aldehyde dehydrogenase (NAD+)
MEFLQQLKLDASNAGVSTGTKWITSTGENISSYSPVDGKLIGSVTATDNAAYETVINTAHAAFLEWRKWPAPKRGEVVRQ